MGRRITERASMILGSPFLLLLNCCSLRVLRTQTWVTARKPFSKCTELKNCHHFWWNFPNQLVQWKEKKTTVASEEQDTLQHFNKLSHYDLLSRNVKRFCLLKRKQLKVAVTVFAVTLSPDSELLMTVILAGVRFSNSHVDPVQPIMGPCSSNTLSKY